MKQDGIKVVVNLDYIEATLALVQCPSIIDTLEILTVLSQSWLGLRRHKTLGGFLSFLNSLLKLKLRAIFPLHYTQTWRRNPLL